MTSPQILDDLALQLPALTDVQLAQYLVSLHTELGIRGHQDAQNFIARALSTLPREPRRYSQAGA